MSNGAPPQPTPLDRVRVFIRNQAGLTDGPKPKPGPGRVELNHAEAMQVADWLDELAAFREHWIAELHHYRNHDTAKAVLERYQGEGRQPPADSPPI